MDDIWQLPPGDKAQSISSKFEHHWEAEMKKEKGPSLVGPQASPY